MQNFEYKLPEIKMKKCYLIIHNIRYICKRKVFVDMIFKLKVIGFLYRENQQKNAREDNY